VSRLLTAHQHK